jgi:hypothetical protein
VPQDLSFGLPILILCRRLFTLKYWQARVSRILGTLSAMDAHMLDTLIHVSVMRITEGIDWQALQCLSHSSTRFMRLYERVKPALLSKLMLDATRARVWLIKHATQIGFARRVLKRKPWLTRWHYKYGCHARWTYRYIRWPKDTHFQVTFWQIEHQIHAKQARARDTRLGRRHA